MRRLKVHTWRAGGRIFRMAVLTNDWAVPVGWRYDFPMDCWHIVIFCWHLRTWRE